MDKDKTKLLLTVADAFFNKKSASEIIEEQEAQGQKQVCESGQLPKKANTYDSETDPAKEYKIMGIKIVGDSDDLFYDVELPEGWSIKPTDHSMWNELFDDKGRKRANFFYKAAFYDSDAFINFNTRYTSGLEYDSYYNELSTYEAQNKRLSWGAVKDCGKSIYETEKTRWKTVYDKNASNEKHRAYWHKFELYEQRLKDKAKKYLKKKFPKHADIHAYWD